MLDAIASSTLLKQTADTIYPGTGTAGHILLLSGDLPAVTVTVNLPPGLFAAPAHGLAAGTRVRITSTGSIPAPFQGGVDYWVFGYGLNTFLLTDGVVDGVVNQPILATSTGSGTIIVTQQPLLPSDELLAMLSRELSGGGIYQRLPLSALGTAVIIPATGSADKAPKTFQIENTGATAINYRHILIGLGASSTIGDGAGITGFLLATETAPQSILPGETRIIVVTLQAVRVP